MNLSKRDINSLTLELGPVFIVEALHRFSGQMEDILNFCTILEILCSMVENF